MAVGHADLIIAALARHNGQARVSESTYGDVIRDAKGKIEHGGSSELIRSAVSDKLVIVEDGVARINPDHPQSCDIVALVIEHAGDERLAALGIKPGDSDYSKKCDVRDIVLARRVLVNGRAPRYETQWDTTAPLSSIGDSPTVEVIDFTYSDELIADARSLADTYARSAEVKYLLTSLTNLSPTVCGAQDIAVRAATVVKSLTQQATAVHRDFQDKDDRDFKRAIRAVAYGSTKSDAPLPAFLAALLAGDFDAGREHGEAFAAQCLDVARRMQAELAAAQH